MRWSLGRALPEHVLVQLSAQEKEFFKDYDRVVMKYMKDVCDGLPLDITLDQRPPPAKDNNIRVRVITEPENDIGPPFHRLGAVHPKTAIGTITRAPRRVTDACFHARCMCHISFVGPYVENLWLASQAR